MLAGQRGWVLGEERVHSVPTAVPRLGVHLHPATQRCLLGRHQARCQEPHVKTAAGEAGRLLAGGLK